MSNLVYCTYRNVTFASKHNFIQSSPVQDFGRQSLMAGGHLRQLVDPEISFIEKSNLQFDKNLQMLKAILIKN